MHMNRKIELPDDQIEHPDEGRDAPLDAMLERIGPIQPGDVLVFRGFDDVIPHEEITETVFAHYRTIADATEDLPTVAAFHIPLLVFAGPGQTIEHLDEDEMRAHGWVRA